MVYVTWKFERTPFDTATNTWDAGSAVTLTEYYDPLVRVNSGDARDSFQFKVSNTNGDFDNYFQTQDKITISRVVNSSSLASSDIIMVGSVQAVPVQEDNKQDMVRVEGYNFSEAVLSGIVFVDADFRTIPQAIQDALLQMRTYNANFQVTWHPDNPTTTTTGGAFPTVGERWFNKPLKDQIEKYSTREATGDVRYYWFVDKDNKFVWRPMTNETDYEFDTSTDDYLSLKISKDAKDVKNWIIVKGGVDPKGTPIQSRVQDLASQARHGLRYYIVSDIAKDAGTLHEQDKQTYGVDTMADASYPLSTDPYWVQYVSDFDGTVTNYDEYVSLMRTYVKEECDKVGKNFLEARKYGRLQISVEFKPGKGWGIGDVVSCSIAQLTKSGAITTPKLLRVKDIQYGTTSDVFTLEEDYGSV